MSDTWNLANTVRRVEVELLRVIASACLLFTPGAIPYRFFRPFSFCSSTMVMLWTIMLQNSQEPS